MGHILAITGHTNIEKTNDKPLFDHDNYEAFSYNKVEKNMYNALSEYIEKNNCTINDITFISGMARGVDEIWALLAVKLNLPLILSVPNSISWHKTRPLSRGVRAQAIYYDYILHHPKLTIHEIMKDYNNGSNEFYPFANFARNQHMVDISTGVLSYKRYDSTGTDDCIKRAQKANKYLGNIKDY